MFPDRLADVFKGFLQKQTHMLFSKSYIVYARANTDSDIQTNAKFASACIIWMFYRVFNNKPI